MSLLFLILTGVTWTLSHFYAKRITPSSPTSFDWTKKFNGNLEQFTEHLHRSIKNNPDWLLLEKTKTKFIISESPSLFQFGSFYHIHCKETSDGLVIEVKVQAKLVTPNIHNTKLHQQIFANKDYEDVS